MILKLYEQGLSKVEIAKQLGRGLGEVNLVIELYKGTKICEIKILFKRSWHWNYCHNDSSDDCICTA